jgi:hypothetical protein
MPIDKDFLIRDNLAQSQYADEDRKVHHQRVVTLGNAKRIFEEYAAGVAAEIPPWWRLLMAALCEAAGNWVLALMGNIRTTIKLFLLSKVDELVRAGEQAAAYFGIKTGGGFMGFVKGKLVPKPEKVVAAAVPLAFDVLHWRRLSRRIEKWREGQQIQLLRRALPQRLNAPRYRRKVKSRK